MLTKMKTCPITFINDFVKTFLFYVQNAILFTSHLIFHIVTKTLHFIGNKAIPATQDLIHSTQFFLLIVYQGFCEFMALGCISMSSMFIKLGKFFNNQSEKLLHKCGW